eukprot:SAG31_NODE_1933_length_6879_cov_3.230973_3_plen_812_part_00
MPKLGLLHEKFNKLPTECEVLVQVMASSVNPCDRGTDRLLNPKVLGSDIAGVVAEVGNFCTRLKVGMHVWADIGAVVYMKDNEKTKELGAYAEYALALESQLGIMPSNLGWMEAGSLPKVALTSFKALVWYAGGEVGGVSNKWIAGKTVLVLGGSGGTGTTGIQLAKALGAAKVLTTAGAVNAAYCTSIGADEVIDYHTKNWWDNAVVRDNSVDVVYDCVGQAGSGGRAMLKLREGGYYVTIAGGMGSRPRPGRHQAMFINSNTNLDNVPLLDSLANFSRTNQLRMPHLALPLLASCTMTARHAYSLDGEWNLQLQGANNQSGPIKVPGSWEGQGFGTETVQMWHQVLTGDNARGARGVVGVYSKPLKLPAEPCPAGHKVFFMVDQGIHRHAFFKVGNQLLGEHVGYLTPFEAELSAATVEECCCGSECTVEVTLDGGRTCDKGGCSDALMGAADDDTDGTGLGGWAGLNGHVSVECRPPIFLDGGIGNIVPPHVRHPPVTAASAGKPLDLTIDFVISGGAALASATIFDNSSGTAVTIASSARSTTPQGPGNVSLKVTIPAVQLWSPENRSLYTAVVTLSAEAVTPSPLDQAVTRFGVRSIVVEGHKLMLNGQRVFLAGYGDDSIYPATVAPPRVKALYEEKVKFAHEHGFNFVRHHSHVLPQEYFGGLLARLLPLYLALSYSLVLLPWVDAADEWGIMVSPELPCVYGNYFAAANRTAQELYLSSWASYIASYRNHPSIFTWTLCNEMYMGPKFVKDGETFGAERFFAIKKALDPSDSRLMMDQDGACSAGDVRESLSFCSHGFDVFNM